MYMNKYFIKNSDVNGSIVSNKNYNNSGADDFKTTAEIWKLSMNTNWKELKLRFTKRNCSWEAWFSISKMMFQSKSAVDAVISKRCSGVQRIQQARHSHLLTAIASPVRESVPTYHISVCICMWKRVKCFVQVYREYNKHDVHISYLPLPHLYERIFSQIMYLYGGRVGFFRGDVKLLLDDMQTLKPTIFPAVPRLLNRIYDKVWILQ